MKSNVLNSVYNLMSSHIIAWADSYSASLAVSKVGVLSPVSIVFKTAVPYGFVPKLAVSTDAFPAPSLTRA